MVSMILTVTNHSVNNCLSNERIRASAYGIVTNNVHKTLIGVRGFRELVGLSCKGLWYGYPGGGAMGGLRGTGMGIRGSAGKKGSGCHMINWLPKRLPKAASFFHLALVTRN